MQWPKARQGKALTRIENPGEHRAPGSLNRYLVATDSQGEKGPEDEPLSQAVAWPCLFDVLRTSVSSASGQGIDQSGSETPTFGSVAQ